eukprot:gnl/TRDRNA2_/TRDRNA2_49412_c0_seq1.p1 gnl/TRDRNA2_/TRDRNA2_49412_c0~~gnl/TRDRNA2_/TRDRNA2_49412_c0_seq1.p1  ORF type:complete len:180 (-),score=41.30 gnl/TRDRNA2_/TRDRNA2_49412_c0_seq1:64-603(-)
MVSAYLRFTLMLVVTALLGLLVTVEAKRMRGQAVQDESEKDSKPAEAPTKKKKGPCIDCDEAESIPAIRIEAESIPSSRFTKGFGYEGFEEIQEACVCDAKVEDGQDICSCTGPCSSHEQQMQCQELVGPCQCLRSEQAICECNGYCHTVRHRRNACESEPGCEWTGQWCEAQVGLVWD